ncbi:glycosyltransferase family 4 protein [Thermogemmatispora sp.]|nr:glycosyltransferase family 4 protein [Thermogemmatispora sp.]
MTPLRIVHISYDWYRFDPLVRRLAEAARARGHLVDVICLRHGAEPPYEECNGVSVYRVPLDRGFGQPLPVTVLGWLRFLLLAAWMVTRLHFRKRYDVVQVHNMPDFLVFAALVPRLFGARVILEVQDASPELMAVKVRGRLRRLAKTLAILQERLSTLFADHVITVGWPFEEVLLRRGVPRHKLSVILNSPDPRYFPPSRRARFPATEEDGDFILMYHGTMAERHGLDIALRALALALPAAPRLRLDLLGRGEQIPFLRSLAEELGISDRVTFRETCTVDKVADFIAHGDVGIIPYRCDGFMDLLLPTKAYEFAWLHRPIIAADTKAIRSMFRPESVMLCEPENPLSFAAAFVTLYHHPEKRAQLIENAAQDFEPFRWESMSERYNELLERLCGHPRSTAAVAISQQIGSHRPRS